MSAEKFIKAWKQIIAKCWSDPTYKKKVIEHPENVLKEHGISIHNKKIIVHEDKPGQIHLSIPMRPEGLSDKDLQMRAGEYPFVSD